MRTLIGGTVPSINPPNTAPGDAAPFDVEGVVGRPTGCAGDAVVIDSEGNADERANGGGGSYEASAGKDLAIGRLVVRGLARADGSDFKSQRRLCCGLGRLRLG